MGGEGRWRASEIEFERRLVGEGGRNRERQTREREKKEENTISEERNTSSKTSEKKQKQY